MPVTGAATGDHLQRKTNGPLSTQKTQNKSGQLRRFIEVFENI